MYPNVSARLGAIYALLGVVLLAALVMSVLGLVLPKSAVSEKDLNAARAEAAAEAQEAAGEQNLYAICEASITNSVTSAGGTVQSYKAVKVTRRKNGAKVTVTLASDVYMGNLTCDMAKSNWQVAQVAPG